jgi:putative CocE/NonD family hydrolase
MSLASRLLGRFWKFPAAITHDVTAQPLRIPMRDGVELLADRYYSRTAAQAPTVLIRSCYGRSTFKLFATFFAERGMQVVIQSCRGTFGSQGTFRPFFDELNDGEDTVAWMERQPWFSGKLALWGISYLGNTAWAVAASPAASKVDALGLHVTLTNFRDRTYAFDGFTLLSCAGWTATMVQILRSGGANPLASMLGRRKMNALSERAVAVIPLRQADRIIEPRGVSWWQDWMDHAEPGDPWWAPVDYGAAAQTLPPTVMVAGWYDIFLPFQLRDFAAALNAGRDVRITIGPWTHVAVPGLVESLRQSMALFQERFGIGSSESSKASRKPGIRLFLMGANEWREYPSWPPPGAVAQALYLHPGDLHPQGGGLSVAAPASEGESAFDYDPSQPTPALHGANLESRKGSGDMAELERRSDVLVFTAEPVASDLDAIGPVSAEIFLRSNTRHTDLYLCLCDVTPGGRSTNVCDGYRRLRPDISPGGDARKVSIEFWPTAYRFKRGHRVRIIVASGAHPRYSRNPGSGQPLGDATTMVVAHQQILHGPRHPSAITLAIAH